MSKEVFKLGELFCGPGGIAYGAQKAVSDDGRLSITHAWANDFDPDTCETYTKISVMAIILLFTAVMSESWIFHLLNRLTLLHMVFPATVFLMLGSIKD